MKTPATQVESFINEDGQQAFRHVLGSGTIDAQTLLDAAQALADAGLPPNRIMVRFEMWNTLRWARYGNAKERARLSTQAPRHRRYA